MKIILIRQAAADTARDRRYDSASFESAVAEEQNSGIAPVSVSRSDASAYQIYTGTARVSVETAETLFDAPGTPERTPLLDDVALRAFRHTEKQYPLWLWRGMGRMQWFLGSKRQTETRKETIRRAKQLIDRLEAGDRDCVLITTGLMLKTIRDTLYRRGYCIEGGLRTKPLDRIRATRQTLHCGGCIHNCMLSDPGCGIGKDKARQKGFNR